MDEHSMVNRKSCSESEQENSEGKPERDAVTVNRKGTQ
jgi:hypothetical protein